MRIPLAACTAVKLHETNAALDEAARQEAVAAEDFRGFVVEPVELFGGCRLARKIHRLGSFGLHAKRQLIAFYSRVELGEIRSFEGMPAVELFEERELLSLSLLA